MDLSDILSTPPTGLRPGTSPKRLRRHSSSTAARRPPADSGDMTLGPSSSTPAAQYYVHPTRRHQIPQSSQRQRLPGDQIWQSLSRYPGSEDSDLSDSDPTFDSSSDGSEGGDEPELHAPRPGADTEPRFDNLGWQRSEDFFQQPIINGYPAAPASEYGSLFDDLDEMSHFVDLEEDDNNSGAAHDGAIGDGDDDDDDDDVIEISSRPTSTHRNNDNFPSQNTMDSFHTAASSTSTNPSSNKRRHPVSPRHDTDASPHGRTSSVDAAGPQSKRRRPNPSQIDLATIPSVNLVDDEDESMSSDMAAVLGKQRAEQVASQQNDSRPSAETTKLTVTTCSVCMSQPREAIATVCGHVFCRPCLMQWVSHNTTHTRKKPTCPSCRTPISTSARSGGGRYPTMVNLEFKRAKAAAPPAAGPSK